MRTGTFIDSICSSYYTIKDVVRRGDIVTTYHLLQTWGSTAIGFNCVGGQAFTEAYTTVIVVDEVAYVFFNGAIAYVVEFDNLFQEHLANRQLLDCRGADKHYKKVENDLLP